MKRFLWSFLLIVVLLAAGCGQKNQELERTAEDLPAYPILVHNYTYGGEATDLKFSEAPQRVVVCREGAADTMIALKAGNRIAAVWLPDPVDPKKVNEYHREIPQAEILTGPLDRDQILSYQPDMVIGWREDFSKDKLGDTTFWLSKGIAAYIEETSKPPMKANRDDLIPTLGSIEPLPNRLPEPGMSKHEKNIAGYSGETSEPTACGHDPADSPNDRDSVDSMMRVPKPIPTKPGQEKDDTDLFIDSDQFPPGTVESEIVFISQMGDIFNRPMLAENITEGIIKKIEVTRSRIAEYPSQKTAAIEFTDTGIHIYGLTTLCGDMITKLGGSVLESRHPMISEEELIQNDPDVIFVIYRSREEEDMARSRFSDSDSELRDLTAVKNGRVYGIPFRDTEAAAVHTAGGLSRISHGLYPDLWNK